MKTSSLNLFLVMVFCIIGCATIKSDLEEAERLNTAQSYQNFLNRHPEVNFEMELNIKTRIEKLEVNEILQQSDSTKYKDFIRTHSDNAFLDEVLKLAKAQVVSKNDMDIIFTELFYAQRGMSGPDTLGRRRLGINQLQVGELSERVRKLKPDISSKLLDEILLLPNTELFIKYLEFEDDYNGSVKSVVKWGNGYINIASKRSYDCYYT